MYLLNIMIGKGKKKKKNYTTKKKNKHKHVSEKLATLKYIFSKIQYVQYNFYLIRYYSIDGSNKIVRTRKACPECGPGQYNFRNKIIFEFLII